MNEARGGSKFLGRDYYPACFTLWMAGGGIKRGVTYGATDDFGYHAVENVSNVWELYATVLHLLGLDHEKLAFHFNGAEQRLTFVHGRVIQEILA